LADDVDEIRAQIDIVTLVGREIPLKQKGKNWTGLCPFHSDKNPSFNVSSEFGRYTCWSCGEKGDIFNWVMKRRNVDFAEALEILAREAGVELHRRGAMPASTRQTFEGAMDAALAFFREEFAKNTFAQEYCTRRGLDNSVLSNWEIGYAPDVREALPNYIRKRGFSLAEAQSLYLVDGEPDSGYSSRFWGRLMFPIRDEKGALVAFGGRILGDGHPKYINSSDTPLYRKSRVLYGMHRAKEHMSKSRRAVLVEGYLDVIACHHAGVQSAVASLGTSLTDEQARLLKRWCDEVVILYDSDEAGQKAAGRAVDVLKEEGLRVRIALMPDGDDPDTLLKRDGPQAVQRAVEGGLSPSDFRLRSLDRKLSPDDKAYWAEVAQILSEERDNMELVKHVDRLAGMYPGTKDLELAKKALQGDIVRLRATRKKGVDSDERPRVAMDAKPQVKELIAGEVVIFCAFLSDEFRRQGWMLAQASHLFASGLAVRLSKAIKVAYPEPPVGKPALWLANLKDEDLISILADLAFDPRGARLTEEFLADTLNTLQNLLAKRQRQQVPETSDRLSQLNAMLRQTKTDHRQKPDSPDDLF